MQKVNKYLMSILYLFMCTWGFSQEQKELKIGLVLSGGGAKGFAHVGVLEVIEEAGLKIDYIGGTSMGAVIGALYASGYNAKELKEILNNINVDAAVFNEADRQQTPFFSKIHEEKYIISLEFDNLKLKLPTSIASGQGTFNILTEYLSHVHGVHDFNELATPFLCIGTNLETGEQKIFNSGYLPEIVMASAAYPTLFEPVEVDSAYYIDGGVVNNYPAQEVLDMGATYLIGVDLGAGLQDYEELTNATDIIAQIVSYGIEAKTKEQRKLIDLAIVPDVKEISVTNFQIQDSIYQEGYKAALKLKPTLDSLRNLIGTAYRKEPLNRDSTFVVSDIKFNGLEQYSENYVIGKLGIQPSERITYNLINEGVSALSATDNFNKIEHRLSNDSNGEKTLILDIEEDKTKFNLKLGLHYDKLFKTALLVNFTAKNLLSINSTLSIDAIAGDNPRFNLNYFVDNGIRPSFGFNTYYQRFTIDRDQFDDSNNPNLNYNYKFRNLISQLYTQSTLAEKYAIGLGVEYNYLKIYTNNVPDSNPLHTIQNSYFLSPYAFIKADTRDNSFFPTTGFYLDSEFKYYLISKEDNFQPTSMLKNYIEYNIPVWKRISIQPSGVLALSFENALPDGLKIGLGGLYLQDIANTFSFYGLPLSGAVGNNLISAGMAVQYNLFDKHFIKYNFNGAHISNGSLFDAIKLDYVGHGLTYGYLSPLGPLQATFSYSPERDDFITNIALGYWF